MDSVNNDLSLLYKARVCTASSPLIYLVHGRAGTVDVMSIFQRSVPEDWNIVQMRAPLADAIGGYSWWKITDGSFDPQEALLAVSELSKFRDEFLDRHSLKPSFEVGVGFSQGAGLLSVLLQKQPSLFRGIGILAGFVIELEHTSAQVFEKASPRVFWAHGSKDPVIKLKRAEKGVHRLREWGLDTRFVTDEVGHKIGRSGMRELRDWLKTLTDISS